MPLIAYENWAVNSSGDVVGAAAVEVRLKSDDSLAVIYSDETGTALANPFTADSGGKFEFWAGPDLYRVLVGPTGTIADIAVPLIDSRVGTASNPFASVADLLADTTAYSEGQRLFAGLSGFTVAASGATDQHLTRGDGLKLYIDETSKILGGASRPVFDMVAAPSASRKDVAVIERRRTDYLEYSIYTPMSVDGGVWQRWNFSNRFSAGAFGAPVFMCSTLAYLYESTALPLPAANIGTGTIAVTPADTQTPADASDTGTWTAPATVLGVTTISYPSPQNSGATRIYTIDNSAGDRGTVFLRGTFNVTNGGVASVVVKLDGVEISEIEYSLPLVGGERLANYRSNQITNGQLAYIPACAGVGAGEITIEISESATNGTGHRVYDGGVIAYDAFPYNTAGLYGLTEYQGSAYNLLSHSGTSVVYRCDNATAISWKYRAQTVSCVAEFTVLDNAGVEVASYTNASVDTYNAGGASDKSVDVVSNLATGTYWLHVTVGKSKNAAATRYSLYDRGVTVVDATSIGTVGVDDFLNTDTPANPTNAVDFGSNILMGPSNLQFAIRARQASEPAGVERFLSGAAHGFETEPTDWALFVDGVDQTAAYNALAVGGQIIGATAKVTYSTEVKSPTSGTTSPPTSEVALDALTTIMNLTYQDEFSGVGYLFTGGVERVADAVYYDDFGVMLQVFSVASGQGAGGGFDDLAVSCDGTFLLDGNDDSKYLSPLIADQFAYANDEYASACKIINRPEVDKAFLFRGGAKRSEWHSYSTGRNKAYSQIFQADTNGKLIYAGDSSYRKQILFSSFSGASLKIALGI